MQRRPGYNHLHVFMMSHTLITTRFGKEIKSPQDVLVVFLTASEV